MDPTRRVDSPCIRRCTLDEHDVCIGCLRSIDEILVWSKSSDEERLAILERTRERRTAQQEHAIGRPETTEVVRRILR